MKQDCTADEEEDASDFIPDSLDKKPESTADDEFGSDFLPGSSEKMMEEKILRPEASYVDKMNLIEIADMMKVLNLNLTLREEEAKQRIKEHLFSGQLRELHSQKMQNMVEKTIKKYKDLKQLIIDQYSTVKDLIEKDMFVEEMKDIMNTRFPNFDQELETRRKKLNDYTDEFEIVVIGETSAGKSTFLNVLLGNDSLPSHLLHTTTCLCRLHNSVDNILELTTDNRSKKQIARISNPDVFKRTLTEEMKSLDEHDKSLAVIDIYCPIPWLQENIVLVDTPGIGERNALTMKVAEYVPNAAGYIFIVDSSRAGGIQEGGIVKLLDVIQTSADETGSEITDLSNILVLCNKWDLVQQEHRYDVSQNTKKKLTTYCGGPLQDWQTVKFNAQMELKLQKLKANPTKSFEILVRSLEELMVKTIDRRLGEMFQWILNFVKVLDSILDARVKSLLMLKEELDQKMKMSKERLNDAADKLREYEAVENLVRAKGIGLVNNLRRYLEGERCMSKLLDWSDSTYSTLHVQKRFGDVILEWAYTEPGVVKEASALVEEKCRKVEAYINSSFDSANILNLDLLADSIICKESNLYLSFTFRVLFTFLKEYKGLLLFLWIKYVKHKRACFIKTALKIVLSGEILDNLISSSFTCHWHLQLNELKRIMKARIDSLSAVMKAIQDDRERKIDVQSKLSCLKLEVTETLKHLRNLEQYIQRTSQY